MFTDVDSSSIRRKIVLTGGVLIVAPFLMLSIAGWIVVQRISQSAAISGVRTSNAQLVNLTRNLVDICQGYQRESLDALKRGRSVLDAAGSISLNPARLLAWRAKNDATARIMELRLPVMAVGHTDLLPVADFSRPAPIVDEIEKMNGTPATIFQRMDERGDMLRICTSLQAETGTRAIGSYIPNASGSAASAGLADVLAGRTFLGTANFSKTNYLIAYQPLADPAGKIVGMLATAMAEEQIAAKVRSLAALHAGGDRAGLFAWRAAGADRGAALVTADRSLEGQDLWNRTDASGGLYVQQICLRAAALPPGEIAEYKYQNVARVGGIPQIMLAKFAYVPGLDWVVGYAQPEADFLAGATPLQGLLNWGMWLLAGVGLAGSGLAVRIWIKFAGDLASELSRRLTNLTEKARELSVAALELSADAKRTNKNAGMEVILSKAGRTSTEIGLAIHHIDASRDSVSGVLEAIEQIAFATNMLAVNSALEASHADGASQPIAGIAEELRQLAERCRLAVRETQTELQQGRIELEKGHEEVLELVRSQPQADDGSAALQRQAENLIRLAEGLDRSVEHMSEYLGNASLTL